MHGPKDILQRVKAFSPPNAQPGRNPRRRRPDSRRGGLWLSRRPGEARGGVLLETLQEGGLTRGSGQVLPRRRLEGPVRREMPGESSGRAGPSHLRLEGPAR